MTQPSGPVRVMIVEDSLVVRRLLEHIIAREPRLLLVAAVASAEEALAEIDRVRPDVISMDIRLPGIDGLEATRLIMSSRPTPIVVIADAVESETLKISLNALRAGALAVVEKPVGPHSAAYESLAETIISQLLIMSGVPVLRRRDGAAATPPPQPDSKRSRIDGRFREVSYVALAASTGGPPALASVLGALPGDFAAALFVVQHIGAPFVLGFSEWLGGLSPFPVRLAQDGATARPGHVYVAPGGRHLEVRHGGRMALIDGPPIKGHRPAANRLFASLAQTAGPQSIGVLLTGMGEDGAEGLLELRKAGGHTIAEHECTAVVYGMPAAAVRLQAACEVLPLDAVGRRIAELARRGARP